MLKRSFHQVEEENQREIGENVTLVVKLASGPSSREGCTVPLFVVLFTVARPCTSALQISGGFLHSTADISMALLEPGGNIG